MTDDHLMGLRELGAMPGAPAWIPSVILEIEELQARLERLEQDNEELRRQLAFYRRRVAA